MCKVALIIMDGIGINTRTKGNAVYHAKKPNLDKLFNEYPHTLIEASGEAVGLPAGQMGNSEVGHLNIGAGRIVYTGLSIINNAIKTGAFNYNEAISDAISHAQKNHSKLHLLGLVSHGGVHSSWEHLLALIDAVSNKNIPVVLHVISDGRDVKQQALLEDLRQLLPILQNNNIKLGSISGRYYAMDRDKNFDRVQSAYRALVCEINSTFNDPIEFVEQNYLNGINDEFIKPAFNASTPKDEIALKENDSIIFFNFRPDRAREISHLIFDSNLYDYQNENRKQNLFFVTMMKYDGITPSAVAFAPQQIKNGLGEVLAYAKLNQLRVAETEKYAHVTFFFDGGEDIDYEYERKIIVESKKNVSYDLVPQMGAYEICKHIIDNMDNNDVIIANFANGDMVGHTGNFDATVKAVEIVDECIGTILEQAQKHGYTLMITADHGNADEMLDENDEIVTSHTSNKVPFIITDKNINLNDGGKLANIAPTILRYIDVDVPKEMEESLIKN